MKEEFSVERKSLQTSLETTKQELQDKTTQLDALKTEVRFVLNFLIERWNDYE